MFKHACSIGLEGVVSKVRDSRYNSGRGNDWVKKTCAQRETLAIAGFAMKGNQFDGLYVAGVRAMSWSMPARWTTALTTTSPRILEAASSR
jgi:ATP-dependent DNA ligase